MIKDIGAWTPYVLIVVYALPWDHDDRVLLQKVTACQCGVVLYLLNVDDAAVVSQGLVEHRRERWATRLDQVEVQDSASWDVTRCALS